jgi:hypothetical protein
LALGAATPCAGRGADLPAQTAFKVASALRGPLEGDWRLRTQSGRALFAFQLSDPGGAPDAHAASPQSPAVEGAWLDLRGPKGRIVQGPLDSVRRQGRALTVSFREDGVAAPTTVELFERASGWRGRLIEGGRALAVILVRPPLRGS